MPAPEGDGTPTDRRKARTLVEKKTAINLVEAFAVAVKHYLRGEEGIYYIDLYHLVKFLPSYALPAGIPSNLDLADAAQSPNGDGAAIATGAGRPRRASDVRSARSGHSYTGPPQQPVLPKVEEGMLPPPVPTSPRRLAFLDAIRRPSWEKERSEKDEKVSTYSAMEDGFLLPARNPPRYHLLDLWPLSMVVKLLTKKGKEVKVRRARWLQWKDIADIRDCRGGPRRGSVPSCAVRL